MRVVLQRVSKASVSVNGELINAIGKGLCVFVGIQKNDTKKDMEYMVRKVLNTRLFEDDSGKRWQLGVKDCSFDILCISQFTLYCKLKGNKPDYSYAMAGEAAKAFYEEFLMKLKKEYRDDAVKDGIFGAMMEVNIVNDGPVTLTIDSTKNEDVQESEPCKN